MGRQAQVKVQVKGFLTPVFTQEGPDGRTMNGLDPESFEMVREGFACADCLAIFSIYTITCPVCGLTRDVAKDFAEAPELWNQHIRERNAPWTAENKQQPVNPLVAIGEASRDAIPVRKLSKKTGVRRS